MKKPVTLPQEIENQLESVAPELAHFVRELYAENHRLQKQIAKLKAQKLSCKNMVVVLENELEDYRNPPEVLLPVDAEPYKRSHPNTST